jgi:hypothetical protein
LRSVARRPAGPRDATPTPAKKRPPLTRHSTPRRPAVASHRIARPLPPNRPAGNGQRAADH